MIALFDGEYAFLSNFYPSPFTHDGIMYPTNEHFFQAMKTLDIKQRQAIANASTPGQAKRMGRQVDLRPDWETSKEYVMELGLKLKFQNPILAEKLKATKSHELIEGTTWHDNEWGSCSCPRCINIRGKNKLGNLLMKVRKELLDEETDK